MRTRRALLAGLGTLMGGCAARQTPLPPPAALPRERLAPVRVSRDRVIREVVGLRPYRPSGFVVRKEALGGKTLVHNYGHGGGGISLSWGTARLATALATEEGAAPTAVLGCGVAGLTAARLLQLRGARVTIYTKDTPPDTTSNIAGGLWSPVTVYEKARRTDAFFQQFVDASRFSFRYFQYLTGRGYGVRWTPVYYLHPEPGRDSISPTGAMEGISDLFRDVRRVDGPDNPFGTPGGQRVMTLLIEPYTFLDALLRDFFAAGGKLEVREFRDRGEVEALPEPMIVNSTGLGARALFGDEELMPIKGQLVFLLPQPEVDYMTVGPSGIYMFPRKDGILLGGTHERGEWSLDPDPAQSERILNDSARLFGAMA
ncbi:MAG: FAD-dependent oxidoreductase [Bryobacterales bacterium]|nr:FAD-dependent oxidoreductase [Bryobacterales bacterium]